MTSKIKKNQLNMVMPQDSPVHNWYRFVLSFPPHLVRDYLAKLGADEHSVVLDPFCGTGTTLVECKKLGIRSCGWEANAMAHFASTTKTSWQCDPDHFIAHCQQVAEEALDMTARSGISLYGDTPLFGDFRGDTMLRDLTEEQWQILSRSFISPLPLHRTLILLETMRGYQANPYRGYQELALAKALVSRIGNVAFGPEIGATPPKSDIDVVSIWLSECKNIAHDLEIVQKLPYHPDSSVIRGDSRSTQSHAKLFDIVITSPPYPNEKDYTRTTRLESVILGFIANRSDLRALKQGLLRSNTRNVYTVDDDQKWIEGVESVQTLARQIEERRIELGKTSGFERLYHRVVELYFGGMARHLIELKQTLKPGAQLAYVVGDQMSYFRIPIRTGTILADIAERVGYKVQSIDLFRTRLATVTKEWIREEVVVLSSSA
ncbi:MAG: DNA methyltransferase [Verrucomicrobiae bacterium]|nr:DNA methyltransferase [Verrucomicrobiae bacterium]